MADIVSKFKDTKYIINGLTVVSNNDSVNPRDTTGNIIVDGDSSILTIEGITYGIINNSVLPVIDTQFRYFKFPATTTIIDEPADLNLDLNLDQDIIYARYKPSEPRRINKGSLYSGILMDDVEDGLPQKNTNAYYISKEIKNSGKDLRIRIALQHRYDSPVDNETSDVLFSLIKTNVDTGINRTYRLYPEDDKAMSQYQVKTLLVDDILLNSDFDIGDTFLIGAVCEDNEEFKYHTINAVTSYWVITDNSKNVDEWNQELPLEATEATAEATEATNQRAPRETS
jgi:hypothetical protein